MKRIVFYLIFLLTCAGIGFVEAQTTSPADALAHWKAGTVVTEENVRRAGEDRCFGVDTLSDDVFARMWGKSYTADCRIPRSQLRYVRTLHYDAEGRILLGEMVCNRLIASDVLDIFRELYRQRYPIGRMVLIDNFDADDERSMRQNNTCCFCYRTIAGSRHLSWHARGLAVDINTLYNPCVKRRADGTLFVQPSTARRYTDRTGRFPYKIVAGDLLYRLFTERGFVWGGHWKSTKDYQHFEKHLP